MNKPSLRERAEAMWAKHYGFNDFKKNMISDIEALAIEVRREAIEECAKVADVEYQALSDESDRMENMDEKQFDDRRTKSDVVASLAHQAHTAYDIATAIRQKLNRKFGYSNGGRCTVHGINLFDPSCDVCQGWRIPDVR